jgi:predicted PurR-regulated permease PerM
MLGRLFLASPRRHCVCMSAGPPDVPPIELPPQANRRQWSTTMFMLAAFVLLAWIFSPIWKPLLLGTVFAASVSRPHDRLARRLWNRTYLSATIFTLGAGLLILAPLTALAVEAVRQAIDTLGLVRKTLQGGGLQHLLRALPDSIENVLKPLVPKAAEQLPTGSAAGRWAVTQAQGAAAALSEFAFDVAMMMIAFFFVLTDGKRLVSWLCAVSPLGGTRTRELLDECRLVARSVIGSNVLTGVAQAAVAMIGYLVVQAPKPLFFGLCTLLASFIPSVGTAIVSLPLAGLLFLMGRPWAALFLAAWALLLVSLVDNLMRPWLIRGDVQIHGAVIFFALIGGILLFGFTGLVVGPLALSLFMTLVRFHNRDLRMAAAKAADGGADPAPHPLRSAR